MTALERAKAFVQSRAAKTALKILPLALATVVGVSTKAHATVVPAFTGTNTNWTVPGCSSGSGAPSSPCLSGFSAPNYSPFSSYGSGGVQTGGSVLNGTFKGAPGAIDLQFLMSGGATGSSPEVGVKWQFEVDCPSCSSSDTFYYEVNANVGAFSGQTGSVAFSPNQLIDPPLVFSAGALGDWQATIDLLWSGQDGEAANFTVDSFAIYPTEETSPVPEPSSLLLAFSGLPFVLRTIRKKR